MNEEFTEMEVKPKSNRRTMLIGGVAAIVLGCCAILFVLVIGIVVDPFDLNVLDRLNGRYDAATTVMPVDTAFYMGVNIVNINPAEIDRITKPFIEAVGDPDVSDLDGAESEFTEELEAETGIVFEEDVMPWIGQYLGFGVTDITLDQFEEVESASWVLAVESRDNDKADAFLLKLRDSMADAPSNEVLESTYQGVTVYELRGTGQNETYAFGRSGRMVIVGSNLAAFQSAIDAQDGDSLNETEAYEKIVGDLPRTRAMTFYTEGTYLRELLEKFQNSSGVPVETDSLPLLGFVSSATTLSIVEAGVMIDSFTYTDPTQLTTTQKALFEAAENPNDLDEILPSQTVAFFGGQRLDLLWLAIREATGDEVSFDESMEEFGQEFGINPSNDIFPLLDGSYALALMPTQSGLFAEELDVPLGILFVSETTQPQAMGGTVEALREGLENQQLFVAESQIQGATGYEVGLGEGVAPAIYFGLEQNYFYLASSSDPVQDTFGTEGSLAQSERYQQFLAEFSNDINVSFYIDVRNLLGTVRESRTGFDLEDFNDTVEVLGPIEAIGLGNAYDDDIRHTQIIVFVETE